MEKSYAQAISERRRVLQNPYAFIPELEEIAATREAHRVSENPYAYDEELTRIERRITRFDGLSVGGSGKPRISRAYLDAEIEQLVRDLHVRIWDNRASLFPNARSMDPVQMLDPVVAFNLLGYEVQRVGALGQMASESKVLANVAGMIDKDKRLVLLSSGFPVAVSNFTAAHELGHAQMHEFAGMHRDLGSDGASTSANREEREADKFAALFLMPGKLLKRIFEDTFKSSCFELTDETRFALRGAIPSERWTPKRLRDLSRLLSSAPSFDGRQLVPLSKRFRVSQEAMAIRLEQLGLLVL